MCSWDSSSLLAVGKALTRDHLKRDSIKGPLDLVNTGQLLPALPSHDSLNSLPLSGQPSSLCLIISGDILGPWIMIYTSHILGFTLRYCVFVALSACGAGPLIKTGERALVVTPVPEKTFGTPVASRTSAGTTMILTVSPTVSGSSRGQSRARLSPLGLPRQKARRGQLKPQTLFLAVLKAAGSRSRRG